MSKNINNNQENSPKSFEIMANALGVTQSEFNELIKKKETVSTDSLSNFCYKIDNTLERVYPKIWNDSISDCYTSLAEACKLIDEAVSKFNSCDSVLRDTGYPINHESPTYKEWGLTILERCLKSYRK